MLRSYRELECSHAAQVPVQCRGKSIFLASSWHGQGAAHQGLGQAGFGSDSYLNKMLKLFSSLCEQILDFK